MPEHLALIGPTGSGKSDLAMRLARELGDLEIVSIDSIQVYRGLDIGTAKPTAADRAEIPHHCLDLTDPDVTYSVADFQTTARAALADIAGRGKRALLVAGTGLYLRAVIDDFTFPGEDLVLREELEAMTATPEGLERAFAELQAADPLAASRMDPSNQRRVVRALEVIALTGEPFSSFGPGIHAYAPPIVPIRMIGLGLERDVLSARITARVERMRELEFVEEVRQLAEGPLSRTARIAIGYAELLAYLDGSQPDLDEAFQRTIFRTRNYARKQRSWYRRDPRIAWLDAGGNPSEAFPDLLAWATPTSIEVS